MTLSTFRNKLWHSQPHQSLRSLISTRQPALEAVGVLCRRVLIANRLIPWYQVDQTVSELIAIDSLSGHLSPRVCAPVSSYSHHLLSALPAFVTCLFVEYARQEYPHEQVGKRIWLLYDYYSCRVNLRWPFAPQSDFECCLWSLKDGYKSDENQAYL